MLKYIIGDDMKKMVKLLICIFTFVPLIINARVNYEDAAQYTNHYIYNFEEYNDYIYLKSNTPYEFDSKKNIINSKFTSGGFLSKAEYEISNIKGNSYLSNGLQYWTLTKSSHQKHYMVDYKLLEQLDTNLSGVRITEYTKPDVVVSGIGTYSNPWTFDDMLSIHINSDNKYIGKVSTVECSNEEMRKESIHLNVVGDKARAFYICPEPGYKFLKSTCSQYITNHNLNNMYTVENLDRDNVICKVYYSYETKKITAKGCPSCATGKTDRTLYVNNTHKIWLLESDGINKIETINDLPTKKGYTFKGYYTSDTNFSEDNKVIESTGKLTYNNQLTTKDQLHPYMKANEYTIKYSCNNGTGATEQSEHTYDEKKNLTSNGCTRQGYKFEGWSTSSTGSKVYSNNQEVLNLTDEDGKEITLYAVWTQCPAGTYGSDGLTCTKCPAGTYNSNKGSKSIDACQKCIAGTYSGKGASSCTQCKEGTYSETIGASSSDTCIKCGLGYYASNKGSTTCSKCPKGTYADKEGLSECISCGTGYTSLEGSDSKEDCEVATTLPSFKYTGKFQVVKDDDSKISEVLTNKTFTGTDYTYTDNWKVRFLSDGKLTVYSLGSASKGSDFFIVGSGKNGNSGYRTDGTDCGGSSNRTCYGGGTGGTGGACTTKKNLELLLEKEYEITVGKNQNDSYIIIEGSTYTAKAGAGAAGGHGYLGIGNGGPGQDGCHEFDENNGKLYAGGGGGAGGSYSSQGNTTYGGSGGKNGGGSGGGSSYWSGYSAAGSNGEENTGGGGGAGGAEPGWNRTGGSGGSGIVIWRNSR